MKCPKCKADNPDIVKFCGECGTQLTSIKDVEVTETIEAPKEELTRGTTFAGRYEIIEELGKGGMGRVYRVEDTRAKEEIALKLIKSEIASDKKTIERFRNELTTARKITHKNVCRMYDLGEEKGLHFITMEYISGQDLKGLIRQTGQLIISKAISIAMQICNGLAEAQSLGVVHRDLKPNNIMIDRSGNAKIMDFGIARAVKGKSITGSGVMIGTPQYMSPEQVEGKEVDQRSDIYSLGIILYEMVTGRVPFEGDTPFSIGVKQKSEIPRPAKEINDQIPEALNRVILNCMEKDKESRYQSVDELHSELMNIEKSIPAAARFIQEKKSLKSREITATFSLKKWIIPALVVVAIVVIGLLLWRPWAPRELPSPSAEKPSIAVLPFKDLSPQMDQQHLCSGIPSDLVQRLTQVEGLWIPAWASSSAFNSEAVDIRELGKKLNVDTVLTGTLQKADDKLRITVELINIADNDVIWTERYERDEGDIFELQDDVTLAIIDKLKVKLLGEEKAGLVKRYTDNVEAYNLYLQGRFLWNKRTPNDIKKSIEFYEKAIEKDHDFALAYAGIADSYINLYEFTVLPPMAAFPNAKKALNKALELNDSLGEAHCSLAYVYYAFEWDFKSAEKEFKRAIELNPNYATAHQWYAQYLAAMERFKEAYKEIDKALELDPLSLIISNAKGQILYFEGRYEDSIEQLQLTLEIDDRFLASLIFLGWNYMAKGMYQEAIDITQKALTFYEGYFPLLANSIVIYALSGQRKKAQEMFDDLMAETSKIYMPSYVKAAVYRSLGEKDKAFEWLERAYDEKDIPPWILKSGLWDENLRSDPRFKALLKKMNLE